MGGQIMQKNLFSQDGKIYLLKNSIIPFLTGKNGNKYKKLVDGRAVSRMFQNH